MRSVLFKNITCDTKRRRIISSSECFHKDGAQTLIHRHFICQIREVGDSINESRPAPYLYVLKEKNKRRKIEKFFCRLKGSMYVKGGEKTYLVLFSHSLKILIKALVHAVNYT